MAKEDWYALSAAEAVVSKTNVLVQGRVEPMEVGNARSKTTGGKDTSMVEKELV